MQSAKSEVFSAAMKLAPEDRAILADQLLQSLTPDVPEIGSAWMQEIDQRIRASEAGKTKVIPADEVFAEFAD